jgi:hypothetical protein
MGCCPRLVVVVVGVVAVASLCTYSALIVASQLHFLPPTLLVNHMQVCYDWYGGQCGCMLLASLL